MSDEENQGIKVTDRRMFTETGELREQFENVEERSADPEPADARSARPETVAEDVDARQAPAAEAEAEVPAAASAPPPEAAVDGGSSPRDATHGGVGEPPEGYSASPRQPQFLDLVAMLAEPAALFLGDASMPGQEPMEDLERARMHIDLLGLLETKCVGNLTEQESLVLSDLVYRLRLRYVEKKG